jgi:hypothetical protein
MNIVISSTKRGCRLPALAQTFLTALFAFRVTVVAAEAIPAPGTKPPPVTGDRPITAAEVPVERVKAVVRMGERCVALHKALDSHHITHEYYVGGYGGHDWATWRHLLYDRFLPSLWRKN